MVAVDKGSRYSGLECTVCHQPIKPGDHILPSFRGGRPRAMHAHMCSLPRHAATVAAFEADVSERPPAAA